MGDAIIKVRNASYARYEELLLRRDAVRKSAFQYGQEYTRTFGELILKVFEKSGIQPWDCFLEEQMTWHERFLKHGFKIISEEIYLDRRLNSDDNELGRIAEKFGIKIEMQWNAFILEKTI